MYDDERVMGCLLKAFFVWIVGNGLLSQPFVESSDNSVSDGVFFQNVIDLGLRCAEQNLTFGGFEKR